MDMTLNEYLGEVDRWKQVVSDRMARLNPAERAAEDRDALAWLEKQLGRRLHATPATTTQETRSAPRLA